MKKNWRPFKKGEFPSFDDCIENWTLEIENGEQLIYSRAKENLSIVSRYARTRDKKQKPLLLARMIRGGISLSVLQDIIGLIEPDEYYSECFTDIGKEMQQWLHLFKKIPTKSNFFNEEIKILLWLLNNVEKFEKKDIKIEDKIRVLFDGKYDEAPILSFTEKIIERYDNEINSIKSDLFHAKEEISRICFLSDAGCKSAKNAEKIIIAGKKVEECNEKLFAISKLEKKLKIYNFSKKEKFVKLLRFVTIKKTEKKERKITTKSEEKIKEKLFKCPHPFLSIKISVFVLIFSSIFYKILLDPLSMSVYFSKSPIEPIAVIIYSLIIFIAAIFYSLMYFMLFYLTFFIPFIFTMDLGANNDNCRLDLFGIKRYWRKKEKKWVTEQVTYSNILCWVAGGCFVIINFFIWKMWVKLAAKMWQFVGFLYRFFINESRINIKK